MIEFMDDSGANVIGVRMTGKLTRSDYDDVLTPRLAALIEQYGAARALIMMDENFEGWDLQAAWANTKLDFRFRNHLEKVAIIGAPVWEEWCVKLASLLVAGELRTFRSNRVNTAWAWLRT